jgi:hypothetical protein
MIYLGASSRPIERMPHEPVSTLADVARKIELRDECRRQCHGETMLSQDLVVVPTELVPTEGQLPAIIQGSGRKARDRIEHFLRAAIDNDNTRRAYGRALGSFFAFLEDGGRERV